QDTLDLLSTPAVRAALPFSRYLAESGLTPLSIFYAMDGVSYLIERLIKQGRINRTAHVILAEETVSVDQREHEVLTLDLIIDEIGEVSACGGETARGIYKWLIQVAQYKPFLFPGFRCEPARDGNGVHLFTTPMSFENLFQRWGLDDNGLPEMAIRVPTG